MSVLLLLTILLVACSAPAGAPKAATTRTASHAPIGTEATTAVLATSIATTVPETAEPTAVRSAEPTQTVVTGGPGYLGVYFTDIDLSMRRQFHLPDDARVMLLTTLKDSPAFKAGLRGGMPVYSVNGVGVKTYREAQAALGRLEAGSSTELVAGRNRARYSVVLEPTYPGLDAKYMHQLRSEAQGLPQNPYAQWAYGFYLLKDIRVPTPPPDAQKALDRLISLTPSFAGAYVLRAELNLERPSGSQPIDDLGKAIEMEPFYGDAFAVRAVAWARGNSQDPMLKDIREMEKRETSNDRAARAYLVAAEVLQHSFLPDRRLAERYYLRSLALAPTERAAKGLQQLRASPEVPQTYTVTYKISGPARRAWLTYVGPGETRVEKRVRLPWKLSFKGRLGQQTTLIALVGPDSRPARCEVHVDGVRRQRAESGPPAFSASCLGRVGANGIILNP